MDHNAAHPSPIQYLESDQALPEMARRLSSLLPEPLYPPYQSMAHAPTATRSGNTRPTTMTRIIHTKLAVSPKSVKSWSALSITIPLSSLNGTLLRTMACPRPKQVRTAQQQVVTARPFPCSLQRSPTHQMCPNRRRQSSQVISAMSRLRLVPP